VIIKLLTVWWPSHSILVATERPSCSSCEGLHQVHSRPEHEHGISQVSMTVTNDFLFHFLPLITALGQSAEGKGNGNFSFTERSMASFGDRSVILTSYGCARRLFPSLRLVGTALRRPLTRRTKSSLTMNAWWSSCCWCWSWTLDTTFPADKLMEQCPVDRSIVSVCPLQELFHPHLVSCSGYNNCWPEQRKEKILNPGSVYGLTACSFLSCGR